MCNQFWGHILSHFEFYHSRTLMAAAKFAVVSLREFHGILIIKSLIENIFVYVVGPVQM